MEGLFYVLGMILFPIAMGLLSLVMEAWEGRANAQPSE